MSLAVLGSPVGVFADAVIAVLQADATLVALMGGTAAVASKIVASLPTYSRTACPYIVVGQRGLLPGAVAMQQDGGEGWAVIDVWSAQNGPNEVQQIQSRIRAVLSRSTLLTMVGYVMYSGSLAFQEELVLPEDDPDMPERSLYHGVQRVTADLELAA